MSGGKKIWLTALGYWLVASLLACTCYSIFLSDTIYRYGTMAEAFASGDFMTAFHPRFGILWPALVGSVVWLTHISAEDACQIVAIGFSALSIVPAWHVLRKLFDEEIAWFTVVLMMVAPEFFIYSLDGLRESSRMFGMIMLVGGVILSMRSWMVAVGLFVLATSRADAWVFACFFFVVWIGLSLYRRSLKAIILPIISMAVANLLLTAITYAHAGVPVPYAQIIWMASRNYIKWL